MNQRIARYFDENKPYVGLGRASLHSGVTFVVVRGFNILVQFATTIWLARLLGPHDVGLVALVLALIGFAPMLIDMGAGDASAQKPRITPEEISALFWMNVAISLILTTLLVGASGVFARVFGEPSLTGIMLLLSTTLVLTAITTQHSALMRRAMEFRRLATIDIASNIVGSLVAVVMALTDWGYWSLAAKPVITAGVAAMVTWMSCRWIPGRPRITPEVTKMVRFGVGVTGFTLTDYFARSADRLAIGYFLGVGSLGYFQNAYVVYSNLLSILAETPHNIAVSGLSKLRSDVDALKRAWASALSLLSFFSSAAFAVLAVLAQDFVVILLGQHWAAAGPLLCIFAVKGIAHALERTHGWVHVAYGQTARWARWGLFSAACQLAALFCGLPFGVIGVATAFTIVTFGLCVPAVVYAGRPVGIGAKDVLRAVGPQIAAGLVTVALGLTVQEAFLGDLSSLKRMCVSGTFCFAVYFTIVVGVFKVTAPLRLAFSVLRDYSPRWLSEKFVFLKRAA